MVAPATSTITLPPPNAPLIDENGNIERSWYLCLQQVVNSLGGFTGTVLSNSDLEQLSDENLDIATVDLSGIAQRISDLEIKVADVDLQEFPAIQDVADALLLANSALDEATSAITALQPVSGLAGSYTYVSLTLNTAGQITAISNGSAPPSAANPTGTVGLSAVNGVATTYMRSDAAPPLSQSITPTWTSTHIFSPTSGVGVTINAAANSNGVLIKGSTTTGQSFGAQINAGTNTSDTAFSIFNAAGSTLYWDIRGDGSIVTASTLTQQGPGTLNTTGLFVNNVAVDVSIGANPTASIGLSAVNGVASTWMRSDAAPALSQGIAPTWTGTHTFSNAIVDSAGIHTYQGTTASTNSGVAVNLQALPNVGYASYLVTAGLSGVNDATNYVATYLVHTDGTAARITAIQAGGLLTCALAGLTVQATQNSGGAQAISYTIFRIA